MIATPKLKMKPLCIIKELSAGKVIGGTGEKIVEQPDTERKKSFEGRCT